MNDETMKAARKALENVRFENRKISQVANWVAFTAAVVTGALGFTLSVVQMKEKAVEVDPIIGSAYKQVRDLRLAMDQLKREQSEFEKELLGNGKDESVTILASKFDAVEARQKRLEAVIMADPIKSLEIPMLRKDLEGQIQRSEQSILALRESVNQVYDLSKWLLGTLVIGVFSLALSNFFSRKA
jgi:hypothetical protein